MKVKKASNSLPEFSYQTPGCITSEDVRSKFFNYQSVTVNINPSITIPNPGMYYVSMKIGSSWYEAIAAVAEPMYLNEQGNRGIRVYITNFSGEIINEKVLVSWPNFPEGMSNRQELDEFGKVSSL